MNSHEIQEFRSSGVLALLGLVGLCLAIIATPWNRHIQDSNSEVALRKAEVVGYQVVQLYREATSQNDVSQQASDGRSPASTPEGALTSENMRKTGLVGQDPWGRPYHYRIISADKKGQVRLVVWSSGPNKKVDSPHLENEEIALEGQPVYAGDDVGVLLNVSQN